MIKTIAKNEFKFFKSILGDYYEHMRRYTDTFLMRVFGLHKLRNKGRRVYFVVLANVFNTTREINVRYDIKGSIIDRKVRKRPGEPL